MKRFGTYGFVAVLVLTVSLAVACSSRTSSSKEPELPADWKPQANTSEQSAELTPDLSGPVPTRRPTDETVGTKIGRNVDVATETAGVELDRAGKAITRAYESTKQAVGETLKSAGEKLSGDEK
jgi:hypothetical protein